MQLYDSLKKDVRIFEPLEGKKVRMYACGPTVYSYTTIGNLRTFCTVDLLRRYLEYRDFTVDLVMNITDVGHAVNDEEEGEDKLDVAAAAEKKTPLELAAFYTEAFFRDIEAIGIKKALANPKATEHIPEMVALAEELLKKGIAYQTEKGDVYFDVSKFPAYGALSGNDTEKLKAGARVEIRDEKRHPGDFALWIHNPKHVMQWDGPNGIKGYPGWHLECSAMAMKYLGPTIDIHLGGEDLKFPHHECEIAQTESLTGAPLARFWVHVKYLMIEGEKMSKSKGNATTLSDLISKGFTPEAVRCLLLSAHYRTPLNFTMKGLEEAQDAVRRFRGLVVQLKALATGTNTGEVGGMNMIISDVKKRFEESLDDDLNMSGALAALHDLTRQLNKAIDQGGLSPGDAAAALMFLEKADSVFVLGMFKEEVVKVPEDVQKLVDERAMARVEQRWEDSDRLRDEIAANGFNVKDTAKGQEVTKK